MILFNIERDNPNNNNIYNNGRQKINRDNMERRL
jgi:hypothetical protein